MKDEKQQVPKEPPPARKVDPIAMRRIIDNGHRFKPDSNDFLTQRLLAPGR